MYLCCVVDGLYVLVLLLELVVDGRGVIICCEVVLVVGGLIGEVVVFVECN